MPTCPNGHHSPDADYCTTCGARLVPVCPNPDCRAELWAGVRYCEVCGQPLEVANWSVSIAPDRLYFEARDGARHGIAFPERAGTRRVALVGDRVRIGRRSGSRDHRPEIDLSTPLPRDPAVSRRHAELVGRSDGGWALLDCGSANGTWLNDEPDRLAPGHARSLADGDRIHVGAWTTLVLCQES